MATAAAAIMAKPRRDVVAHFMSNNAVSPESAVSFPPERRMQRRIFERMRNSGVLVEAKPSAWYLDIPKYHQSVNSRRKRAIGLVGAAILAAAGAALFA